ncbi:MAG: alpha/beta hydrolase [Synechococcales cyanobacterium T60_A2020_003]|nr:alpha/beta hydrolase [Synechococcales cyanobacterium T60_A2020_003]
MNVLLIHGLGRTPLSLMGLEGHLRRTGWKTELFGYAAFAESYDQIAHRLHQRFQSLAEEGTYAVVAHSLGGLLTRSALAIASIPTPHHIVMLGTPNQSPRLARHAWKVPFFQWFSRDCGANLANPDFFADLPHPLSPYTIIAGTSGPRGAWSPFGHEVNDGIVALDETRITEGDRPIQLPVNHTFMMYSPVVQETVVQAIQTNLVQDTPAPNLIEV